MRPMYSVLQILSALMRCTNSVANNKITEKHIMQIVNYKLIGAPGLVRFFWSVFIVFHA